MHDQQRRQRRDDCISCEQHPAVTFEQVGVAVRGSQNPPVEVRWKDRDRSSHRSKQQAIHFYVVWFHFSHGRVPFL